jgi:hypothetical protein
MHEEQKIRINKNGIFSNDFIIFLKKIFDWFLKCD